MIDIFVCCERDDQAKARKLVQSLRAVGYSVAVDLGGSSSDLPSISNVSDLIASVKVVVTIWTSCSVDSDRVIDQSIKALEAGKYIGVMFEKNIDVPVEFNEFQAADMSDHDKEAEEFDWLCGAVDTIIAATLKTTGLNNGARWFSASDTESAIWYKSSKSDTVQGYEFYLEHYGHKGAFYAQALDRRDKLTTWPHRLGKFTNKAWVKGVAATVIVCCIGAVLAVNNGNANMIPHKQYAELQEKYAELQDQKLKITNDLVAANDSRLRLIASYRDKVSRNEYVALSEHARDLEQKIENSQVAFFDQPSRDLRKSGSPAAFNELNQNLDTVLEARQALETVVGRIEPASGSPWTCTVDGNRGVNFASACWSRDINTLSLNGFGTEYATTLKPVELLRQLEILEVAGAHLNDLGPLASMSSLRSINVSGTGIESIGPLAPLVNLESLDMRGTGITDLSPLKEMRNLKSLCPPNGPCILDDIDSVQSYLDENVR